MSPRVHFPLDAEGHRRFHQLLGAGGMQFVEGRREKMPAFEYDPMLVVIHGDLVSPHGTYPKCELRSAGGKHEFVLYVRGRSKAIVAVMEDLQRAFGPHLTDRHENDAF